VDDAEHGRSGQEDLRPVLMRPEEAKKAGPLGEPGEEGAIVARQPAIEGPVAHAFEGMQESQGDHLTGREAGLGMVGEGCAPVIDTSAHGRFTCFRPAWRKYMTMPIRPTSTIGFISLQATNTIGYIGWAMVSLCSGHRDRKSVV